MSYNTKNYMRQGGNRWTIGGTLEILDGGNFIGPEFYGNSWRVSNLVTASGDGKSWAGAFKTITEAVAAASEGDTIRIYGDGTTAHAYVETVTPTVSGLKFVPETPNGVIWTGVTHGLVIPTLTNTYIGPIRFRPASGYGGVSLTGASNNTIFDAPRFQGQTGSKYGILSDGHQSGCKVLGAHFVYFNAATCYGMYCPIDPNVAENASWEIIGNYFHSNTYHLKGNFRYSIVKENTFAGYGLLSSGAQGAPTKCLDFTPGSGSVGNNTVTRNTFGGAYTTALYVSSNANEDWTGNFCAKTTNTGDYGITVAIPAA